MTCSGINSGAIIFVMIVNWKCVSIPTPRRTSTWCAYISFVIIVNGRCVSISTPTCIQTWCAAIYIWCSMRWWWMNSEAMNQGTFMSPKIMFCSSIPIQGDVLRLSKTIVLMSKGSWSHKIRNESLHFSQYIWYIPDKSAHNEWRNTRGDWVSKIVSHRTWQFIILIPAPLSLPHAMIAYYLWVFQFDKTVDVLALVVLCQLFPMEWVLGVKVGKGYRWKGCLRWATEPSHVCVT